MTWRTHATLGICSLWLVAVPPADMLPGGFGLLAAVAALASLVPDLDAPVSKLSAWRIAGIAPLYPVAQVVSRTLGHRGPLHGWPGLVFAACVGMAMSIWLGGLAGFAFWLGYASHLAADACTVSGIPLLGKGRRFWLIPPSLRIVTGSTSEDAVFAVAASAALGLLLAHLGQYQP